MLPFLVMLLLHNQFCPTLCDPMTVACHAVCLWDSLGKNTGVGSHSLPGDRLDPGISSVSCIAGGFFTTELLG